MTSKTCPSCGALILNACRKYCDSKCSDKYRSLNNPNRIAYLREYRRKWMANKYSTDLDFRKRHQELHREWYKRERPNLLLRNKSEPMRAYKRAFFAAWRLKNRARNLETQRRHNKTPRRRIQQALKHQVRRARMAGASINSVQIKDWWMRIKQRPTAICYWCSQRVSTKRAHLEHIIALANGGQHIIGNVCCSCEPCNLKKGASSLQSWTSNTGLLAL